MMLRLLELIDGIILSIITGLEGALGSRLRYLYYSGKLKSCGGYFTTGAGFRIYHPEFVSIGSRCAFNTHVWISASCSILIGDDVIIGPYVSMRDCNHIYADTGRPIRQQGNSCSGIIIGDDVWVAGHCVLTSGSRIGNGSVIAANAVVNKEVPPGEVWGGVPARFIKVRG